MKIIGTNDTMVPATVSINCNLIFIYLIVIFW